MSSSSQLAASVFCVFAVLFGGAFAQLTPTFYSTSCPNLASIVSGAVVQSRSRDIRTAAKLIRLHFHDCIVNGCDASILLDNADGILSERDVPSNAGIEGLNIVDDIKTAVESACPGVVSCADILTLATQIAVSDSGGPSWDVSLGRRDSTTANREGARNGIPSPFDSHSVVLSKFDAVRLSPTDAVALSGGHTFGRSRCVFFQGRLFNFNGTGAPDPNIDPTYLATLQQACPQNGNQNSLNNLDPSTPNDFDNNYFTNLVNRRGLLQTDQDLFTGPGVDTADTVTRFANSQTEFFTSFVDSMIKMGNISPLTGTSGQIRANCHFVN